MYLLQTIKLFNMKNFLFIAALISVVLAGCKKDKEPPELRVTAKKLEFAVEGGTKTFEVKSNTAWTITGYTGTAWITSVSPASGKGNETISVTVSANPSKTDTRRATLTLTAQGISSKKVEIEQAEAPLLEIDILEMMKDKANDVIYTVNPAVLELIGNYVNFSINCSYPAEYFDRNVVMTLTPVLRSGSDELILDTYKVQGENVDGDNEVIKYSGGSSDFSLKVDYRSDFQLSELILKVTATLGGESLDFEPYKLADGIITTSLLAEKTGKPTYASDKYIPITYDTYTADIKYVMCQSDVRASETTKPEIIAFTEAVIAAKANARINFMTAHITGYVAPSDECDDNVELANNRLATGKEFFINNFNAAGVEEIVNPIFLTESVVSEDWDGFKKAMEASDVRDKALILRVLSMYSDPTVRKREIRNISAAYEEIKEKIFPLLDRTEMTVNVEIIGLSDSEINAQFDSDPSKLKLEEILYAGTLTLDLNRKLAIYQAAARQYPNDYRTMNNLGVALLNVGRTSEAKIALNEARILEDNAIVKNNLAVVAFREGNFLAAEEFLSNAGSSDDVKYNLGSINLIQGHYSEAISLFGNQREVNAALAKLLVNQNQEALSTLNLINNDDALVYYLKAIVGARTQNTDLMMNNLRTACEKSAVLKANAKKDIEFGKYFQDNEFLSIVQ